MNRKKQRNSILKKRLKKAKAKLAPKTKSNYVSKAKREALNLENEKTNEETEQTTPNEQA